jgi:hypothetical protein
MFHSEIDPRKKTMSERQLKTAARGLQVNDMRGEGPSATVSITRCHARSHNVICGLSQSLYEDRSPAERLSRDVALVAAYPARGSEQPDRPASLLCPHSHDRHGCQQDTKQSCNVWAVLKRNAQYLPVDMRPSGDYGNGQQ